jgi:outer membrane protein insertion porin family
MTEIKSEVRIRLLEIRGQNPERCPDKSEFKSQSSEVINQIKTNKKELFLLYLLAFYLFLFVSPCEALTAGKVEVRGLSSIKESEFFDMFGIREGSVIDKEKIRDGIKRAFLKGIFEDITVEVSDSEIPTVIISIRERDFIKEVNFIGNYNLSQKAIKEIFLLKEDQIMRYDLLQPAVNQLKDKLSQYGFPEAAIEVTVDKIDKPYRVILNVNINNGPPLIVKRIKISGPDKEIINQMELSTGDIYNEQILNEDLNRMKKIYKEQGYYSPVVGPYAYKNGDLEIFVNPGKKMTIKLEGNSAIPSKTLMREVPFFEIENFNDEVTEEAVDRMLFLYYSEGYAFTQIAPVIQFDDNNITVTFFVFEGEQIKVRSIQFKGVSLSHKQLKQVLTLKENGIYNPRFIEKNKESLQEFYGALGYLEAHVEEIETEFDKNSNTADLIVTIDEGNKTEIVSLEITGAAPDIKISLFSVISIHEGDPYNELDISDARFRILDFYSRKGYTNIDVIVNRNIINKRASIIFNVVEGKKRIFGKTIITGNKKTRYEVIKRSLLHSEGQPYNFAVLAKDRQRLYKLGLFTDIDIEPVDAGGNRRDILIKVKEGDTGSFEFGLGYATYEEFRGFIELSYRNLWGLNRAGIFRTELSSLEERYIFQYYEPWFRGIDLPFRIFFLFEDREEINIDSGDTRYRVERYTVTAGVEKKMSEQFKSELYYEFSRVNTLDVQPDVILSKEDTGTLRISSIKPALIYDTRDDPFEPRKGVIAGISLKVATPVLFSESNFTKLEISGSSFHELMRRVILALSVRGGLAYGFGDTDELPLVERFFLGGRFTVRGYEHDTLGPKGSDGNPTGGNAFIMSNIELRTLITKNIGLVTFVDLGNVWIDTKDLDPTDLQYTSGIGLRYNTPVGPVRVDYGFKLNKEPDESQGEVHFSIGHAF